MVLGEGLIINFEKSDQLIWDKIDDLITVIEPNSDCTILYINEEALKHTLGYNKKDLIRKSFKKYIYPEDLEKFNEILLNQPIKNHKNELNLAEEDLTFLIKFCVKELTGLVKLRNQTITLSLHDELKTKFDKERIYDVLSNLVVNAIKYTPAGGNITIQSEIKNDFIVIAVKDNGIGFTREEKGQVFKQFGKIERYGQGWDVDIEGTGLGLFITKKIIEIHGGKIWFESEGRNKGSSFFFSIPIIK